MLIIDTSLILRKHIRYFREEDNSIALVPTMGNLHNGHIELIKEAKKQADIVVVSIFVNPMQFDRSEDLARYPRTLEKDFEKLKKYRVNCVFSPEPEDIYPKGTKRTTYIEVPKISEILKRKNRPKHFRGVCTIISKLFNLIQPNVACFGQKDFHQLMLIRKIVKDLNYDIEIIDVPIIREKDGLACSSRNSYLTIEQRKIAPSLKQIMDKMVEEVKRKKLSNNEIIALAKHALHQSSFYDLHLDICDADTLLTLTKNSQRAVVLVEACLGKTKLIDNTIVYLPS